MADMPDVFACVWGFGLVGVHQADLIQFLCLAALLPFLFAVKGKAQACIRIKSRGLQCQCQEPDISLQHCRVDGDWP